MIVRSEGDQVIKNIVSKKKRLKSWQTTIVTSEERSNKLRKVLVDYPVILSKSRVRLYLKREMGVIVEISL